MLEKVLVLGLCVAVAAGKSFDLYQALAQDGGIQDEGGHEGQVGSTTPGQDEGGDNGLTVFLKHLLYIPVTDSTGQIQGYFTTFGAEGAGFYWPQYMTPWEQLRELRNQGVLPVADPTGVLQGYYTSIPGGSTNQNYNSAQLTAALSNNGLFPVVNGEGKVVAIYNQGWQGSFLTDEETAFPALQKEGDEGEEEDMPMHMTPYPSFKNCSFFRISILLSAFFYA